MIKKILVTLFIINTIELGIILYLAMNYDINSII